MRVYLSVLGATKTKRGYNTRMRQMNCVNEPAAK